MGGRAGGRYLVRGGGTAKNPSGTEKKKTLPKSYRKTI